MRSAAKNSRGGNHRGMAVANSMAVLDVIRHEALISQRQIVRATGMQPSTVSNIARELKEAGMIRECGTMETRGAGARQVFLQIDSAYTWAASWKIDLNGHQLCLINACGHIVATEKFPVDLGWQAIAEDINEKIARLAAAQRLPMSRFAGLGISVQGIVDSERGEVLYSHSFQMEGVRLREIISRKLNSLVHVERDAHCGAYRELQMGSMGGGKSFLYYILRRYGDFFAHGAGIVINGEVFRGSHSAAGELAVGFFPRSSFKSLRTGAAWTSLYRSFGAPVATLADFLDVDGVIISSDDPGLTAERFTQLQEEILARTRPIRGKEIKVIRSQEGPEGMLIGAGLLVLNQHFRKAILSLPNRSTLKPKRHLAITVP